MKIPQTYFQFSELITYFGENWVMKKKSKNTSKQDIAPWDPLFLSNEWWKQSDGSWKHQNPNNHLYSLNLQGGTLKSTIREKNKLIETSLMIDNFSFLFYKFLLLINLIITIGMNKFESWMSLLEIRKGIYKALTSYWHI